MNKIFLTSDTHFGHNKKFLYEKRGFSDTISHSYELVKKWNSVVSPDDVVYHLGDMMLSQENEGHSIECIKKLNGTIYWIAGNHDTDRKICLVTEKCPNVKYIGLAHRMKYKGHMIYMCHYPTITINEIDSDEVKKKTMVYSFFGHTHQNDNFTDLGINMYHVGVDSHGLAPVLLDDAINELKQHISKYDIYTKRSTFHEWGDGWEHWDELNKSIDEMSRCARKARIFVYDKEKWGAYDSSILGFWDGTVRWLLGKYSVRRETHWYDYVDRFFAKIWKRTGIVRIGHKIQSRIYNREVQKVLANHPNILHELICDNCLYPMIKPTKEGYVDGERIWNLYWKSNKL